MRRADWVARMHGVLAQANGEVFRFGQYDCGHLVAAVLDAMTGSHWHSELAGIYKSEIGARRIMAKPGRLEAIVSQRLGQAVPPSQAQRGDVVALDLESGPALGICVGHLVAVASDGVKYLPLERAHCAWRIQ